MYFGLQSGWVSSMAMPSSLVGFAYFKTLSRYLDLPFSPVENVLVQSVAGSVGTMPLGCGFVGVMPVLNYMLKAEEQGPIFLSLWKLILWSLGLCFFGVVFAVPLRKQVIIREKLKFPSGTAAAMMIGILHQKRLSTKVTDGRQQIVQDEYEADSYREVERETLAIQDANWKAKIKLLVSSFTISGMFTLTTYFFPSIRNIPIFGTTLASSWLWTFNPSLAYIGQGIIMGPAITSHMLLGAAIGWGILSPLAKIREWAPGPVDDWKTGSKGWIVWVSLAIMLADSIISLGYLGLSPLIRHGLAYAAQVQRKVHKKKWKGFSDLGICGDVSREYSSIPRDEGERAIHENDLTIIDQDIPGLDAPQKDLVNNRTVWISGILSVILCVGSIRVAFGPLIPVFATMVAVFMALILSLMGVRALGETDLNPVSGIAKLAQLIFAFIIPQSNKNAVVINLIAGAVSEAGALQAGDLLQDLKTGHLLGAAPNAQFWGQMIGSAVGAIVSALIYRLYTSVYQVPGDLFPVPTGYVWIFTARLMTGQGLPHMAWEWALGAAVLFSFTTLLRIIFTGKKWHPYVPGGIAVAVGMYNVPSFTLARAVGGFVYWYWKTYKRKDENPVVVLASGFILGEGVFSIVNLLFASLGVPHT
ncbi:hypothetical protein K3495_g10384 [Podosphaera aphanis]|nr:hypothetical protein K3495_g10384 [Podosphaera aphanis]